MDVLAENKVNDPRIVKSLNWIILEALTEDSGKYQPVLSKKAGSVLYILQGPDSLGSLTVSLEAQQWRVRDGAGQAILVS